MSTPRGSLDQPWREHADPRPSARTPAVRPPHYGGERNDRRGRWHRNISAVMSRDRNESDNAAAHSVSDEPRCGVCGHTSRVGFECQPAASRRPHAGWCNRLCSPRHKTDNGPTVLRQWTGREANALRCASRMSVRAFAEHLGISARAVSRWDKLGTDTVPRPYMQAILDTALARTDEATQCRFEALLTQPPDLMYRRDQRRQ